MPLAVAETPVIDVNVLICIATSVSVVPEAKLNSREPSTPASSNDSRLLEADRSTEVPPAERYRPACWAEPVTVIWMSRVSPNLPVSRARVNSASPRAPCG